MICSYVLVYGMHTVIRMLPYGRNSERLFLEMLSGLSFLHKSCFAVPHLCKAQLCSLGYDFRILTFVITFWLSDEMRDAMLDFDINLTSDIEQGVRVQKMNPFRGSTFDYVIY